MSATLPDTNKPVRPDWRSLAQKAANETDSEKLLAIIRELCDVLEESNGTNGDKGSGQAA
jgi:hypothetical protein